MTLHRETTGWWRWGPSLQGWSPARWLMVGGLVVLVVGFTASRAKVEFPSPFTARLAAVTVRFYEAGKGQAVAGNLWQLWGLARQHRLAYFITVPASPPRYIPVVLQSLLGWLCLWGAVGLVSFALRCPISPPLWWQLGGWLGCLSGGRILQVLSVSEWLWIPQGRPHLLNALVDMALGLPLPVVLYAALFWRAAFWTLATITVPFVLFFLLRRTWGCSRRKAFMGTLLTVAVSHLFYRLATFAG